MVERPGVEGCGVEGSGGEGCGGMHRSDATQMSGVMEASGPAPGLVQGWVPGLEPLRPELLGPRSVPALVDEGFGALRRHPRLLVGSAMVFLLPVSLVTAVVGEGQTSPGLVTDGSWWAGAVSVTGFSLAAAMLGLPMARAVALEAAGVRPTWRRCHALGWRIWLGAALTWAVLAPLRALALFPMVTAGLVSALTLQLSAVQALEGAGPWRALKRTLQLGKQGFARALGLVCLQFTVGVVVSIVMAAAPLIGILMLPEAFQRAGANLLQLASGLLLCPAAAWSAAAFHLDQRIRQDGLDLEVQLDWWSGTTGTTGPRALVAEPLHVGAYTPLKIASRRRGGRQRGPRLTRVGRGRH